MLERAEAISPPFAFCIPSERRCMAQLYCELPLWCSSGHELDDACQAGRARPHFYASL